MNLEGMTISGELVMYLQKHSNTEMAIRKSADAVCIDALSDKDLLSFTQIIDNYYSALGFKPSESSNAKENFVYRLYRNELAGSSSQVMIAQSSEFVYNLIVNDYEDQLMLRRRSAIKS